MFVDVSSIWLLLWQGYKIRDVGASGRNDSRNLEFCCGIVNVGVGLSMS